MEQIVEKLATLGVRAPRRGHREATAAARPSADPTSRARSSETGLVASVKEAFDRYLGEGRPAYVQRYRLEAEEAVRLVRGAGGTTTVAHPGVSKARTGELERLRAAGVVGLEVHHADHDPSLREKYLRIAEELGLVPTAGSDYPRRRRSRRTATSAT